MPKIKREIGFESLKTNNFRFVCSHFQMMSELQTQKQRLHQP